MNSQDLDQLISDAIERVAHGQGAGAWQAAPITERAALARFIDHTLLKPEAGEEAVRAVCADAVEYGFASVCVHPTWVPLCIELTSESAVKVCSVIGFPSGATLPAIKAYETEQVALLGAQEVDMVLCVGRLRDGDYASVLRDIGVVADAAHEHGMLLKVIMETGLLNHEQKIAACVISQLAGADFVKTATGFNGPGGATVEDIALMRQVVGPHMGVKAAGGVRTAVDALNMIAAGATRIGTSGGVGIMREFDGMPAAIAAGGAKGESY
jgi:deoxyribose-phosphate aldolase